MSEATFDVNVFLSMPRDIHVTKAAAKLIDRIAIEEQMTPHLITVCIFAYHLTSVADEIKERGDVWSQLDGGSFVRDYPDGLATMDMKLPGRERVSLICTDQECEAARMDIEDFVNHAGGRLTRLY